MTDRKLWLIAYDIRAPRRWRRVFRLLQARGAHRQLSVFLLRLTVEEARVLVDDLGAQLDLSTDSLLMVAVSRMQALGPQPPLPGAEVLII